MRFGLNCHTNAVYHHGLRRFRIQFLNLFSLNHGESLSLNCRHSGGIPVALIPRPRLNIRVSQSLRSLCSTLSRTQIWADSANDKISMIINGYACAFRNTRASSEEQTLNARSTDDEFKPIQ